jgi:aryl-alcohol dehydrogenase
MTRAAVVWEKDGPFSIEEVELDALRPDEVRVRLVATGICQSDIGAVRGHFPFPLPAVLGHEGAGVVTATGTAVSTAAVGDRVLLSYSLCGRCRWCRAGHPAYCTGHVTRNLLDGRRPDGSAVIRARGTELGAHFFGQSSFAEEAIVHETTLVVLPPEVTEEELPVLAPLVCGVQAGAGAVLNVLRPHPADTVVVAGTGGVGLSAVMATRLCRARVVIAVDKVASRLELAADLGADVTIDASREDLQDRLAELTGGAGPDIVIDTTGHIPTIETLIGALAIRGRFGAVGVPPLGARASFDVMPFISGKSIQGIAAGDTQPQEFLPVLVEAVRRADLPLARIEQQYAFEDINRAVADTAAGTAIKPVLVF